MNQKTLTYSITIATLLLLLFGYLNSKQSSDLTTENPEQQDSSQDEVYEPPQLIVNERPALAPSELKTTLTPEEELASLEELPFHSRQRSKENIKKFSKLAYLDAPNLEDFMMEDFSQDEVAVLSGKNVSGEVLTLLASKLELNPENLNFLLKSNPELFPAHNQNILEGEFKPVLNNKDPLNGMKDITVFTKEVNGSFYVAAHAPREDGQGTYGFIFEGEKNNIEANYDYLENFFLQFKARKD